MFTLDGNKPDGKRKLTKLFKKHSDYTIHEGLDTQDINGLLQQLIHQNQLQAECWSTAFIGSLLCDSDGCGGGHQ